ncbi:MAG: rod shape-determining protein MreC [Prevotella sp.]|nr:rod shape-determining protein MreC [Prevotella sp.]
MHNLLAFFTKNYHWLIFLLLEVVSGVMLFSYNSYQGSVWISSANVVVGKVYEWEAGIEQYFSLTSLNEQLSDRNVFLEQEVGRLRRQVVELGIDSTELERQEMEHVNQYEWIPAKVVSNSVNSLDNLMTINRGTADGVEADMGVVCGTGLVGVVYQASEHYSVVLPLLNRRSRVSSIIRGRGYFGYVTWNGLNPMRAQVEDIPRHARFEKNDWLETSGFSAIFPPGISIGKIVDVEDSPDGMSYRLHILLSTDFSMLRDVCVVTDKGMIERMHLEKAALDSLERYNPIVRL